LKNEDTEYDFFWRIGKTVTPPKTVEVKIMKGSPIPLVFAG